MMCVCVVCARASKCGEMAIVLSFEFENFLFPKSAQILNIALIHVKALAGGGFIYTFNLSISLLYYFFIILSSLCFTSCWTSRINFSCSRHGVPFSRPRTQTYPFKESISKSAPASKSNFVLG